LLARVSNRIINEVRRINRVVYDISSKLTCPLQPYQRLVEKPSFKIK
jgi:hypothetical protein